MLSLCSSLQEGTALLLFFIFLYLFVSMMIGFYAKTRVKNSTDFFVAGRSLPFYIVSATVFATWFGAEAVLGIPAAFLSGGLSAIVEDPFGSSLCLVLVGLFFARPLYRKKLLTIGDFFRDRYGRCVETACALAIIVSYLGWVSAQVSALGVVLNIVSYGQISQVGGMVIGMVVVLFYTIWGGMWSVVLTDFVQMLIIVLGLVVIGVHFAHLAGGVHSVVEHAHRAHLLTILPANHPKDIAFFISALITMMLGSIPQQDVFQRVTSAKNENVAVYATVFGGIIYFIFAFLPIFLTYASVAVAPHVFYQYLHQDPQMILPAVVMSQTSLFMQVMFFGALVSAIMSTASASLLAPSVTFTENIFSSYSGVVSDQKLLLLSRVVTFVFGMAVLLFSVTSQEKIYNMVADCYKVTLVVCFVPLVAGLYWKSANKYGAMLSAVSGLVFWLGLAMTPIAKVFPPTLAGFMIAVVGMIVGSVLFKVKDPAVYAKP